MAGSSATKPVCSPFFSGGESGSAPRRIKNKAYKRVGDVPSCRVNGYLAEWGRLEFIAMYSASEIEFETQLTVTWPRWAFKLEDISCGLTQREMGSARWTWPRHATNEWIPLRLLTKTCTGAQLRSGTTDTFDRATSDENLEEYLNVYLST